MKMRTHIVATMVGLAALLPSVCQAMVEYLKEEPPQGAIPYRQIVYVDDGTCPRGEVKEITGGSLQRNVPRKVRCVKRPDCASPMPGRPECDSTPNPAFNTDPTRQGFAPGRVAG